MENHFDRLLRLLDLESEAEKQRVVQNLSRLSPREAEERGQSLVGMRVRDSFASLGGRTILVLGKRDLTRPLPWTRLGPGSPVVLTATAEAGQSWRGVVSARQRETISVAFSDWPEIESDSDVRIDLSSDETARQRQRKALLAVRDAPKNRTGQLRDVLLGESEPKFRNADIGTTLNAGLNQSQRDAVDFALTSEELAIIHGPPGTGKTTAVVELIRRAIARGEKVLACAPSNLAVDNLVERLARYETKVLRLGHPARVLPELRAHTLDLMAEAHPDMKLARKLFKEAYALRDRSHRFTRAKPEPGAKREMRDEAKSMIADARRIEDQLSESLLDGADVICATLTGVDDRMLGDRRFGLVVIDEAGQATQPPCWIPLLRSERIVLAGDPWQLPPTVISPEATADGFAVSLLEWLMKERGSAISRRLTVQYRMHADIAKFSSDEFYEGSLAPHESVAAHLLNDLPGVSSTELTSTPIEFVDTAGAGYDEEEEPDGESRHNSQEAQLVAKRIAALEEQGLSRAEIAVITPYAAQAKLLRQLIGDDVEIDTVDGFQGREKEAVIISLVRSNPRGEIGFLSDVRRMNVALTRARRKLIVIGDSATIGGHAFYGRLLTYFEQQMAYRTVWEEL